MESNVQSHLDRLLPQQPGDLAFISASPQVRLITGFQMPYDGAIAAARTCYSPRGIITPEEVAGQHADNEEAAGKARKRRDDLAKDLLKAGHHTVFQHAHFLFAVSGISRHVTWSFLHAHPFYNSEQVSQRFVSVKTPECVTPNLGEHTEAYTNLVQAQFGAYQTLCQQLHGPAREAYFERFPSRKRNEDAWASAIRKRTQEIARYVLPVATTTYLYHTISGLTLMRYLRAARNGDLPSEQVVLVRALIGELLATEPAYTSVLQQTLDHDEYLGDQDAIEDAAGFDALLEGKYSKLVAHSPHDEATLQQMAQWAFGGVHNGTSDNLLDELLSPAKNKILGQNLNLTFQDKFSRVMHHAHYTFAKKLSHSADSQDQRHRLTPASRTPFRTHRAADADYITPRLIEAAPEAQQTYDEIMARSWQVAHDLMQQGIADEAVQYLMPNAATVRFYESGDLMAFRHKMEMRLCYNAQEEIWQASIDEAEQIAAVHPTVGKYLLPPCTLRDLSGTRPVCPEGARFCGIKVWDLPRSAYERLL